MKLTMKKEQKYAYLIISLIITATLVKVLTTKDTYSLEDNTFSNDYILNENWLDYITASEEEKQEYDLIPNKYIYLYDNDDFTLPGDTTYPTSYNLRDYGYVTEPRNQSSLGLCWAFAAISSIESQLLVSKISSIGNPLIFSERQLDYALANAEYILENYNPYVKRDRKLGAGEYLTEPNRLSLSGIAPVTQAVFGTYNTNTSIKKSLNEVFDLSNMEYSVDGYADMGGISAGAVTNASSTKQAWINSIKEHILTYGAMSITTIGPSVGYGGSCLYYDSSIKTYLINKSGSCNASSPGAHAMAIIGWDDDYEYEYCRLQATTTSNLTGCENIVSGRGAFILKNSWGTSTPYPYIAYESAVDNVVGVTKVSEKNWDNNYDTTKSYELIKNTNGETIISYEKNSQIREKLVKVSFKVPSSGKNKTYDVYVSADSSDNYQNIGSVVAKYMGGYSIDVDSNIILNSSEFKIKILSNNGRLDNVYAFTAYQDVTSNRMAETNVPTNDGYIDIMKPLDISTNTRNIPTGATIEYRLIGANNTDISSVLNVNNGYVLNNIVKPTISIDGIIRESNVTLQTLYNQEVLDSKTYKVLLPDIFWSLGDGSIDNPFIVNNLDEFLKIGHAEYTMAYNYKLGNDIDLSKIDWDSNEVKNGLLFKDSTNTAYKFTGSLDGNNHMITGLNYTKNVTNHGTAIFGSASGATFKNLIINDFNINTTSGSFKTLLATEAINSLFENIIITDSVKISGHATNVGGIVGSAVDTTIRRVANYSSITSASAYVSGIVTSCLNCELYESYNYGNISGRHAGGILATSDISYIHDVYNFGNVSTSSGGYAGGIAGSSDEVVIQNVYSISNGINTQGTYGNIVGSLFDSGITNAYSNDNGRALIGSDYNQLSILKNVVTKTNAELLLQSTYTGFDFNSIWGISSSYPYLRNFNLTKLIDIQIQTDTEINMEPDAVHNINLSYYPNNATIKKVKYTSSDDSIASVDINGKVIAKSAGSATITIKSIDGSNITRNITVTVGEDNGIIINKYQLKDDIYIKVDTVTNIEDFLNNISLKNSDYRINLSLTNANVATGEKLFVYKNDNLINTYSITVLGDITGTGTINVSDVAKLYQYIQGSISMDSAYQMAGDVTFDEQLKVNDVAKLYQYVRGSLESLR